MNPVFISLVLGHLVIFSAGEKCQMLDGLWSDDNGSQMRLYHDEDGTLSGSYVADAGELGANSQSNAISDVAGAAVYNQSGAVFSLSLMWMNGVSIKAWIGQCMVCENEEVLRTSWLLRQRADNSSDQWLVTSIGETAFKRHSEASGPENVKRRKTSNHDAETTPTGPRRPCSLYGLWHNELGSQMNITFYQNSTIRGIFWTAVESSNGSAGANNVVVYGMGNDLDTNTAIALYVVWNDGKSVSGFVGQCYLRGVNQTETLETTWLLRSKVNSCNDNWMATRVGKNYFTREKQTTGPGKQPDTVTVGLTG